MDTIGGDGSDASNKLCRTMNAQPSCDVLIVEDDPLQAQELAEGLGRTGLRVTIVRNAAQACQFAAAQHPRVALVDYNLPDQNGLAVAKLLKELSPNITTIMMSAGIEGLPERALEEFGILAFVNKPLPLNLLRQAVQKLVRGPSTAGTSSPRGGWLSAGVGSPRR
jgi:CheY-like chemotaxis protein